MDMSKWKAVSCEAVGSMVGIGVALSGTAWAQEVPVQPCGGYTASRRMSEVTADVRRAGGERGAGMSPGRRPGITRWFHGIATLSAE
jgi:hypothetical protein